MTREHKLALIVGFSLILLVGVLVSDHVSTSKRTQINQVASNESLVTPQNLPKAVDPRAVLALPGMTGSKADPLAPVPVPTPSAVAAAPTPGSSQSAAVPAPVVEKQPVTIAQGPSSALDRLHTAGRDALDEVVRIAGGQIDRSSTGGAVIRLPNPVPAAETSSGRASTTGAALAEKARPVSQLAVAEKAKLKTTNVQPPAIETMKFHVVARGDTLFDIAAKYYGTGHVWKKLAEANDIKGGTVRLGQKLRIPDQQQVLGTPTTAVTDPTTRVVEARPDARKAESESKPAASEKRTPSKPAPRQNALPVRPRTELATYTVRRGDTLKEIAQRQLGSATRWEELAELNKIEDADDLQAGKVLRLPRRG